MAVIEFVDRDMTAKGKDSGPVQKKADEEAAEQVAARSADPSSKAADWPPFSCFCGGCSQLEPSQGAQCR
jgi:hypothetical protein